MQLLKTASACIILLFLFCNQGNSISSRVQSDGAVLNNQEITTASADTVVLKCDTMLLPGDTVYYIHGRYLIVPEQREESFEKYVRAPDSIPSRFIYTPTDTTVRSFATKCCQELRETTSTGDPVPENSKHLVSTDISSPDPVPANPDSLK